MQIRGDVRKFFMQIFFIFSVSYLVAAMALIIMKELASSGSWTCFDNSMKSIWMFHLWLPYKLLLFIKLFMFEVAIFKMGKSGCFRKLLFLKLINICSFLKPHIMKVGGSSDWPQNSIDDIPAWGNIKSRRIFHPTLNQLTLWPVESWILPQNTQR